jgi:hypothetical protein
VASGDPTDGVQQEGISSNQLHRVLGVTLKSAWFMSHRIREAMRVLHMEPLGGVVEIDETFIGRLEGVAKLGLTIAIQLYNNLVI